MAAWPSTLPAWPLVDGYSEGLEDRRIVFEPEYGPIKARPRTSVPVRTFVAPYMLTTAQAVTLETFYRVTTRASELRFDWVHPRTDAVLAARFTKPPEFVAVPRPETWRTVVTLDVLLSPLPTGTGALMWPLTLPLWPLLETYGEQMAEYAIHSDLAGVPMSRRRTTAAPRPVKASVRLTLAQVATFDGFYESDTKGASVPFTWTHPRDGAVAAAFAEGPTIRALTPKVYEVTFALEAA